MTPDERRVDRGGLPASATIIPGLSDLLYVMVQLRVPRILRMGREELIRLAGEHGQRAADLLGEAGDDVQYGGPQRSATLNAVADALAAQLCLRPGGLSVLGAHWCDPRGGPCHDTDECGRAS